MIFLIGSLFEPVLLSGQLDLLDRSAKVIELYDNYGRSGGFLLRNPNDSWFHILSDGTYPLASGTAVFESNCHIMMAGLGLLSIQCGDHVLSSQIDLVGGHGIILQREGNTVTVHCVGEPFYSLYLNPQFWNNPDGIPIPIQAVDIEIENTVDPRWSTAQPIRCKPDENGNIQLMTYNIELATDALRFNGSSNYLSIRIAGTS